MKSVGLWFRRIVDNWWAPRVPSSIRGHQTITLPYNISRTTIYYDDGFSHTVDVELLVGDDGIVVRRGDTSYYYRHHEIDAAVNSYNRLRRAVMPEIRPAVTEEMIAEWLREGPNEERQATDPGYLPFDPKAGGF